MAGTTEPQTDRLATASLNALRIPQISKPGRPLLVTGNDETRRHSSSQPLEHLDAHPRGALGGRLSERTLDDLGPGAFRAKVLHQLSDSGITAIYSAREHHSRAPIRRDHSINPPLCVSSPAAHPAASPAQSQARRGLACRDPQDQPHSRPGPGPRGWPNSSVRSDPTPCGPARGGHRSLLLSTTPCSAAG